MSDTFKAKAAEAYARSVERGEHDAQCEYRVDVGFYLCHCSKRRREAAGFVTPPGDLVFPEPPLPDCPRCEVEVNFDGDGFTCPRCHAAWPESGKGAHFIDDYGPDLAADLAAWLERVEKRKAAAS